MRHRDWSGRVTLVKYTEIGKRMRRLAMATNKTTGVRKTFFVRGVSLIIGSRNDMDEVSNSKTKAYFQYIF